MSRLPLLEERVDSYLGQMGLSRGGDGVVLFKTAATVVVISWFEDGDETFVRFSSIVLRDFDPTLELLQRLLRWNTEARFGGFQLFEDYTLAFSATLLGNHMDFDEFDKTLRYVAKVGDAYADDLRSLAGGRRGVDLIQEPK